MIPATPEGFRAQALESRGTRSNPAYLPADVELLTNLIDQALDAWNHAQEPEPLARFVAENILGLHIDNPPERS